MSFYDVYLWECESFYTGSPSAARIVASGDNIHVLTAVNTPETYRNMVFDTETIVSGFSLSSREQNWLTITIPG